MFNILTCKPVLWQAPSFVKLHGLEHVCKPMISDNIREVACSARIRYLQNTYCKMSVATAEFIAILKTI
jgi:hypothetical protein